MAEFNLKTAPIVTDKVDVDWTHILFGATSQVAAAPQVYQFSALRDKLFEAVAIGSNYAGIEIPPTNGLLVEGNFGLGTVSAPKKLSVYVGSNDNGILVGSATGYRTQIDLMEGGTAASFGSGVGGGFRIEHDGSTNFLYIKSDSAGVTNTCVSINRSNGFMGIGTGSAIGLLHVYAGPSGASVNALADDVVVTNSANVGISLLNPDASVGYLVFGTPSNNLGAFVKWTYASALMEVGTGVANGDLILRTGTSTNTLYLKSTGKVGVGVVPENLLDVAGGVAIGSGYAGTYTAPTDGMLVQGTVGFGISSPSVCFEIINSTANMLLSSSVTDSTTKTSRIGIRHYLTAEEPFYAFFLTAGSVNVVNVGGGTSQGNAANQVIFFTASDNTTTSGTSRWVINSSGILYPSGSNLYDIGTSSNFVKKMYLVDLLLKPASSNTPANNGELTIEATSNTLITLKLKGTDGTVRSGTITLT